MACDGSPARCHLSEVAANAAKEAAEAGATHLASVVDVMHAVTLVATAVAGADDEAAVVSAVLDVDARLGDGAGILFLADEERRELRLVGQRGVPEDILDAVRTVDFEAPLVAAVAAKTRRIYAATSTELETLPMAHRLARRVSARTVLAVPLISRGRLLGVHAIATPFPPPSPLQAWAHQTIAEIIAVGLANAQAHERADRERATLEAVLRSAPYPIVFVESGSEQPQMNLKALEFTGVSDIPLKILTADGSRILDMEQENARAMRGEQVEEQAIVEFPDGHRRDIMLRTSRASSADGTPLGVVSVFEDISDRLALERLREEWASIVAHDMRQPLSVISLAFSLVADSSKARPELVRQAIEMGKRASSRLDEMTHDLTDGSLIEAGRMHLELGSVQLVDVLRETTQLLQLTANRNLTLVAGDAIPRVHADRRRVEQIFTNLLSNAIKYSSPDSEISVDISAASGEVRVDVRNCGPGIPADELPRLFERFYRARDARTGRADGLGLGLFITRGLVEAHGGRIAVTSVPNEQTTFSVTLPEAGRSQSTADIDQAST